MFNSDLIPDEEDTPKLVTSAQLAVWLKVSTKTISNWVRSGILPQPIRLSPRRTLFRTEEVRAALVRLESETWSTVEGNGNGKAG